VLPDSTTLLIDCGFGQAARPPKYQAPRRPDESRLPGQWVARYIKRVHPGGADAPIDYAIVSHFHADHRGGFADLLRTIRVRTFLDRGWPDYGAPLPFNGPLADLYKSTIKEHVDRHGMKVARFKAGAADQIVLRHAPERYRDFEVRNLA
jgi:glyoxylase-like metal-dependent hydrolase (beta-lactamase superfamily II)